MLGVMYPVFYLSQPFPHALRSETRIARTGTTLLRHPRTRAHGVSPARAPCLKHLLRYALPP